MKKALLYESSGEGVVRCYICQRRCKIAPGKRGYCNTRENRDGTLYSLIYGRVACAAVAPIEKKPLYHFHPGSRAYSLGTLGCNFRCLGCQNWELAHAQIDTQLANTYYLSPRKSVSLAKSYQCQGISWTYNEPTIWLEYTLHAAKLAKEEGLYTNYVTNGFITTEALDLIAPYLDSFRVDIKGFRGEFYKKIARVDDFQGILRVTVRAKKKWGMHVEVVTNIIPGYNDSEEELRELATWIMVELGENTPWHVTQFVPHLHLSHIPPTPVKTLEKARQIGFEQGLKFVYVGNIPGHPGEHTYCPDCHKMLIQRYGFGVVDFILRNGSCPHCGTKIPLVGEVRRSLA